VELEEEAESSSEEESSEEEHFNVEIEAPASLSPITMPLAYHSASTFKRRSTGKRLFSSIKPKGQDQSVQVNIDPKRTHIALKLENIILKRQLELESGRIPVKNRAEDKFRYVILCGINCVITFHRKRLPSKCVEKGSRAHIEVTSDIARACCTVVVKEASSDI
jgi:hypothetical protein